MQKSYISIVGTLINVTLSIITPWNSKETVLNGCLVISNHFPCETTMTITYVFNLLMLWFQVYILSIYVYGSVYQGMRWFNWKGSIIRNMVWWISVKVLGSIGNNRKQTELGETTIPMFRVPGRYFGFLSKKTHQIWVPKRSPQYVKVLLACSTPVRAWMSNEKRAPGCLV